MSRPRPSVIRCSDGRYAVRFVAPTAAAKRHTFRCSDNRDVAESVREVIQRLIELRAVNRPPSGDAAAYVARLDNQTRERFVEWGLLGKADTASGDAFEIHARNFIEHLRTKRGEGRAETVARVLLKQVAGWGRITLLAELDEPKCQQLRELWENGDPARKIKPSKPHSLRMRQGCLRQFCRWLERRGLIDRDPSRRLDKVEGGIQRERRALDFDEQRWLIETTATAPTRFGMSGEERSLLYHFALTTGLRSGQIERIEVGQIEYLSDGWGKVQIPSTNNRKQGVRRTALLRPEVAARIRRFTANVAPGRRLFANLPDSTDRAEMVRKDLAHARAVWIGQAQDAAEREARLRTRFLERSDAEGRQIDFHSLRTTLGTSLGRAGVQAEQAATVTGHSDPDTLRDHYQKYDETDQRAALANLPSLIREDSPITQKATGTDGVALLPALQSQSRTNVDTPTPHRPLTLTKHAGSSRKTADSGSPAAFRGSPASPLQKRCSTS